MAPNKQREEHNIDARQLVWYHDLKWSTAKLEARREQGDAAQPIEATLKLSDGRLAAIQFNTPEQLKNLIGSLERAI